MNAEVCTPLYFQVKKYKISASVFIAYQLDYSFPIPKKNVTTLPEYCRSLGWVNSYICIYLFILHSEIILNSIFSC